MIETELKSIIDKDKYNTVMGMFNWDFAKEQINSYYISPDNILKKHGITFRVRTIDGVHKIQIKKHTNKNSALQISDETEYDTDCIPQSFSADAVEKLTGINAPVLLIGSLKTLRHSCMFSDGVEICLDKSDYLDRTDYEIEIEYTKKIPQSLLNQLAEIGIKFNSASIGKFSRFMRRLSAIKNTESC